jgi:site-specific DNA recombinase
MRAAGYIRVSTDEQVREGYGLAAQEQAARAYCQAQGWELVDLYADAGRSGKSLRGRQELARLLEDAQAGRFKRVIFWKLDRLARNLRDLLDICDRLDALGVGIVSVQEAIDTGTPAGRMIRNVLGSLAEFERDVITDRIKAGLAEKARQGELLGPLPLGYQRDGSRTVILDPVTAPLIRDGFARYATGQYSLRDMTQWAAQVGLRSTAGRPLDRLSIRKMFINVTYTGQVAYHLRRGDGIVAREKQPAIVDAALFAEVQGQLHRRRWATVPLRPFGKEPYPLSGVALCARCGASLLGCKASKVGRRYMRCSTAQRQGRAACQQPMVQADLLEAQIAGYVGGMRLPPYYLGEVIVELRSRQRVAPDVNEAKGLQRELERWRRLFTLGEIDEERYRRESAPLRHRLAEIERPHEVLDVERAVNYLRDVGKLWAESPRQLQRAFVREIFQRIVVEGPQVASITPQALYAPLFVLDRRERFDGVMVLTKHLPGEPIIPRGPASASARLPTERDGESRPSNMISPSQARRARPLHPPSLFAHHSRLVGRLHQDGKYSFCPGSSSPARRSKKERAFGGATTKALSLLGAEGSALCEYGRSRPTTCQTVTVK